MLLAVIFTALTLVIALGLATPIVKQILSSSDIWSEKQSYYLSESGVEDVLYRLKSATYNQYVASAEPISVNNFYATTTISGTLDGINGMTVTALSNRGGYDKKIQTTVKQSSGVSFTYGVQVGTGGIILNSSSILGNVYSSGNIIDTNPTSKITGSAIISNSPNMTMDQSNTSPTVPSDTITFENSATTQDLAQSFQVSTTSPLTQLSLYMKKTGSPGSIIVKIIKDKSGSPSVNSGDVLTSAILASSSVRTSYSWNDIAFSPNPSLTPNTSYWIVLDGGTSDASDDYTIGANLDTSYASGTSKIGTLGGTWNNTGYDSYFKLYLGGFFGSIIGFGQYDPISIGTATSDMEWVHTASSTSVTGPLRCQSDTLNNKICDQSYPDPSPAPYPISNGDITNWETAATTGGIINGDYTVSGGSTSTINSTEIRGNLDVTGGSTLIVSGTLYVTGKVTVDGGSTIELASSYGTNSGIIVTDGTVSISGGSKATGDGQSGNYIMIVTTSSCSGGSTCGGTYAMSVDGGSGAVILNAENGSIYLSGGVNVNEATANQLIVAGNSSVTYQTGLANPNFSSGPTGGFTISSWKELGN